MKVDILKKALIKKGIIIGAAVAFASVVYLGVYLQKTSLEEELNKITQESSSLSSEVIGYSEKNDNILAALDKYKSLPENKLSLAGMDDLIPRIRSARTLKEDLELRYKLTNFTMSFSPMEEITSLLKTSFIKVHSNNIEVDFEAITDELAMSFCHSLIEEAPGYVYLQSINLTKTGPVTQEVMSRINDRGAEITPLVKGKVVFNWNTFSSTTQEKPTDVNTAPAATDAIPTPDPSEGGAL